jgi:uncharacterized phiE125 gp8 family phage protein
MPEPLTLDEAKKQLRVDSDGDDSFIEEKIIAAREWVEDYTGLVLTRREVTESLSGLLARTALRAWPVAADQPITIAYRDQVGAEQVIADAVIRAATRPALIFPAAGSRWPLGWPATGVVDATFTAGFASAAEIPQGLKQAMLVMLTAFYEDREGGDVFAKAEETAKSLCRRHKRRVL